MKALSGLRTSVIRGRLRSQRLRRPRTPSAAWFLGKRGNTVMPASVAWKILVGLAVIGSACASGEDQRATSGTTAAAPASTQSSGQAGCDMLVRFDRTTFDAADRNRDGVVDEAEFAGDVAAAFAGEDSNLDSQLARAELPDAPPGSFDRIDSDHNSVISFKELMQVKLDEFRRTDTNGDGVLSMNEVMRYNASQYGGC
jgi:Ca2+-binding EF-hand superfamily protein